MGLIITGIYVTLTLFLTTFIFLYIYFKRCFSYWKKKGVEYLKPTTPLAHLKPIIMGKECLPTNIANIYKQFREKNLKYGGYFITTEPIFIIVDSDLLKHSFVTEFNFFNERGMFFNESSEPLSTHMFAIGYEKWQFLRKKFSPTFTPSKMKTMFPLMIACCDTLKEVIRIHSETGEAIDMYDILARFTTDNIVSCAFGLDCKTIKNPNAEFRNCGMKFAQKSIKQSLSMALALYTPHILKFFRQTYIDPYITKFFLKTLKETVNFRETNKIEREDMLNLLIKLKNNEYIDDENEASHDETAITFNDLAAQAFIFFLGGFETSATTMTFIIYELSLNLEIQEKLRNEVIEITKKYNGHITYESINEMEYLDNIVHESLRKYPPIGMMNRKCSKNYRIPGTDVVLEKGCRVVGSILGIHRDSEYFENPMVFDPDRFSEKRKQNIKPGTYIPWGLGPKACIGLRFAEQQTKIGIAVLMKNYRFSIDPKTNLPLDLSSKTFVNVFNDVLWLQARKI